MVLAIVQARMSSTRLPGKVMADICGQPMIDRVLGRVRKAESMQRIVVATTSNPADDVLVAHLEAQGVTVYRGSEEDVLSRFYWAAQLYPEAKVIVRLTADDPLKDPALIDQCVMGFLSEWAEQRDDINPPQYMHLGGLTWPLGMDVEVFTREALEAAYESAHELADREHVTTWIGRNLGVWVMKDDKLRGSINQRFTVDTEQDLEFVRYIYEQFGDNFTYDQISGVGRA